MSLDLNRNNSNAFEIGIFLSLIWCYLVAEYFYAPNQLSTEYLVKILLIDCVAISLFLFRNEKNSSLRNQIIRITPLFLLGFIIVHFQIYLDVIDGIYYTFGHDYLFDTSIVCKSCVLSSIAMISFFIGYTFPFVGVKKDKVSNYNRIKLKENVYVFPIYILFFVFLFATDPRYFMGGYGPVAFGGIELTGLSYYSNFYLGLFFLGYIAIRTYNLKYVYNIKVRGIMDFFKKFDKKIVIVAIIYFLLILMSGDRGPILQLGVSFLGAFVLLYHKKMSFIKISVFLILGIFVMSFIAYARSLKEVDSFWDKISNANELMGETKRNASISPATIELASSVRTVHAAVSYTESNGYSYGAFQGIQIIGIIPGLGLLVSNIFDIELDQYKSVTLLTDAILGNNPTHSVGTSPVADIYLDFGVFGVAILFAFFGVFIRNVELNVFSKTSCSIFIWVIFFLILSKSVYIGRSTIIVLFREGILLYIIVYLFSILKSHRINVKNNSIYE